jgi:pantetheine-phosphate adenylyltransferase
MSNIYSELWDEMVHLKRLNLQCYVTSPIIHESSYLQTSSYDAIYLNQTKYNDMITILSSNQNNNKVIFEDISRFEIQTLSNKVYFFDTLDSIPTYNRVALGGSFDQLHNGHRKLLTYAASYCSDTLVIGITADSMLTKKNHSDLIAPFLTRRSGVVEFLSKVFPTTTSKESKYPYLDIHELQEPYGPAIVDNEIQALAVSSETLPGAFKINDIRKEKGMKPVDILVLRRTDNAILSSTFIRDRMAENTNNKSSS